MSPGKSSVRPKTITAHLRQIEDGVNALSIADTETPLCCAQAYSLSEDKKTAGIFIHLPAMVEMILRRSSPGLRGSWLLTGTPILSTSGTPLVNVELDRASKDQARLLLSLAFILSVLGLYWVFRSLGYVLSVGASALSVLWTLGIATGLGMTLNMITTVLPVLLWVYTLTGSIHVIYRSASNGRKVAL
jgi:hypothetical protein